MKTKSIEKTPIIEEDIADLQPNTIYTWPLVCDEDNHYKFYNISVYCRSYSRKHSVISSFFYDILVTWGKIDTKGQRKWIYTQQDESSAAFIVADILYKKSNKGYIIINPHEQYSVITNTVKNQERVYTVSLNHIDKLPKGKKKVVEKKVETASSKRFDDLII